MARRRRWSRGMRLMGHSGRFERTAAHFQSAPVNDITRIDCHISKVPVADNRTSAAQLSYL